PQRTILLFERDQFTTIVDARFAARVLQQQQREQPEVLWLIRQQLTQHASESNSLRAKIVAHETLARTSRITLVEDEINDSLNRGQTFAQTFKRRNLVRNARQANLLLRAYEALGQRRFRQQKRMRDLCR